jgi:hypothetical protein
VPTHQQIVDGLSAVEHELYKLPDEPGDSHDLVQPHPDRVYSLADADMIASRLADDPDRHTIQLDLDVPAKLVPSSTEGHSHLYIDVNLGTDTYLKLLEALRDAGVVQQGIVSQLKRRGFTSLRLPWIKKEEAAF